MIKLAGDAMSAETYCTQAGIPMATMPGGAKFNARYKERFRPTCSCTRRTATTRRWPRRSDEGRELDRAVEVPARAAETDHARITGEIAFDKIGESAKAASRCTASATASGKR